ncbi:hypothetical protein [Thalassotalea piscium]|uniref:Uncharacterized protein n=1 Tax=Thalassotalea piscium TaxID=1230533 RepID=A0A7X0NJY2_9GAMM|nr:hypothetical protein [Thalassotalea piscium]MBB6544790.1 hypothetical protein [Thalassotalea piscium]
MQITPSEVLEKIEQKKFLLVNLPNSSYYASRDGDIYSLNSLQPKLINPTVSTTGEVYIALYVPSIQVFNLAELLLKTFIGEPGQDQYPCYKNNDPRDIELSNLYWGPVNERNKWRETKAIERSKEIAKIISNSPEIIKARTSNYYCNKPFLSDVLAFMVQLNRLSIREDLQDGDKSVLRRFITELSEITSVTILNFKKLELAFDMEFESIELMSLLSEYKHVLIKNRKSYCNI